MTWCYTLRRGLLRTRQTAGACNRSKHPRGIRKITMGGYRFMAMSIAATTCLRRTLAALVALALTTPFAAAEGPSKGVDFIRVGNDQMHQLEVFKVVPYGF